MKVKIIIGISIVAAFLAGLEFGITHPESSVYEWNNQNVERGYASEVSIYVMALNAYRRGDPQGCANILENSLENSLFALNNGYSTLVKQPDPSITETLKEARVYRSKYSWGHDNAEMTDDVEERVKAGVDHVVALGK